MTESSNISEKYQHITTSGTRNLRAVWLLPFRPERFAFRYSGIYNNKNIKTEKTITLPWMSKMVHHTEKRTPVQDVQETGC